MAFPDFSGFDKIKFGPGVIGRLTTLVGLAIVVLFGFAVIIDVTEIRVALAIGILLLVAVFMLMAFRYAERNPSTSILEGANAVRYHRQELAAKGVDIEALPGEVREMTTPPAELAISGPK